MKLKLFLLSTVMYFSTSHAQVKTEEPTKTSPSKIRVYTPATSKATVSKDNSYKWAVKTDLFAIITGEFPVIAEYRFAPKFSVEASAAVTYGYLPNNSSFGNGDDDSDYFGSKAAIGSAFRAAIKFYPSSDYDAIEGWNFGFQLFSKTSNREYESDPNGSTTLLNGLKDTKTKTGISLIIGKQIFQDSNVTFESFIGIGIANVKREYYTESYDYTNSISSIEIKNTKETLPNFQLGFRIGFGN